MLGFKSDSEARYQRFLKKVSETKKAYVFTQGDELGCCPSNEFVIQNDFIIPLEDAIEETEELLIVPFWSNEAYPKAWLKGSVEESEDLELEEITLLEFYNLLCDYEEHNFPVGIEWNQYGMGKEITPTEILDDLLKIQSVAEYIQAHSD